MSNGQLRYGDRAAREVSQRVGGNFATTAALTALGPLARIDGMIAVVDDQEWIFVAGSATTASNVCLAPDDETSNGGRWKASKSNIYGSGLSGQTTPTAVTGIVAGTGLSCAIVNGQLVIYVP